MGPIHDCVLMLSIMGSPLSLVGYFQGKFSSMRLHIFSAEAGFAFLPFQQNFMPTTVLGHVLRS